MAATTGRLGVVTAELGNIVLGQDTVVSAHTASAVDPLTLNDAANVGHTAARSTLSTLSLGDQAVVSHVASQAATDTLAIADQAQSARIYIVNATDSLSLHEDAIGPSGKSVTDLLTISQSATVQKIASPQATDLIVVADTAAGFNPVIHAGATDMLSLADTAAGSNPVIQAGATDVLSLVDTAAGHDTSQHLDVIDQIPVQDSTAVWQQKHWSLQVTDAIGIADAANEIGPIYAGAVDVLQTSDQVWDSTNNVSRTVYTGLQDSNSEVIWHSAQSVTDRLSFGESIQVGVIRSTAIALAATDALSLSDAAVKSPSPDVVDAIELGDMALVAVGRPTTDPLTIGDRASVVVVRLLSAEDNIVIEQSFSYTLPFGLVKRDYRPFIGAGTAGNPTPPAATLAGPNLAAPGTFTLVYPSTGTATDTLVLRDPEFGNKDRLQFNRICRETRGGTLIVYADPMWPKTETLVLTFSALTPTQAEALLEFMLNYIGQEIGLWDWEGHYWVGIITNPNDPVVEDSKYSFTAGLEFEGQLVS